MLYNSILARSFSKHDQKKFRYVALIGCLLIAMSFCTVLKPYLGPLPAFNLRVSMGVGLKMLMVKDTTSFQHLSKDNSSSQHVLKDRNKSRQGVDNISSSQKTLTNTNSPELTITNSSPKIVATTSSLNLMITNNSQLIANDTNNSTAIVKIPDFMQKKMEAIICNITKQSDFCQINDNIRIEVSSATVFIDSSQAAGILAENSSWIIRPYTRKVDVWVMSFIKEWSVKSVIDRQELPKCTQNHRVPAILFSVGGYSGNFFHSFTDVLIPLYLTSRKFNGEVQFLATNKNPWWIEKFRELLQNLSKYDIIDSDEKTNDVHCFPGGIIGLKRRDNKELTVDPSLSSYSMKDFRQFLRSTYSLQKSTAIRMTNEGETTRPQLLIISRNRTRSFTNPVKIAQMARRLGYKVVVTEANMKVSRFAKIVNSCDVLLGVHGAGLTNILFLPDNAVVIQVIPIGVEFPGKFDFEWPSKAMNLRYLKYAIQPEESSLIQQYPIDHEIIRTPLSVSKEGWSKFKAVYLDKQDVRLDLKRFRGTLLQALDLLHQ